MVPNFHCKNYKNCHFPLKVFHQKFLLTNKRVEAGLHGHGHAFSEGHEGQHEPNDDVHNPTVNTCKDGVNKINRNNV